MRADKGTGYPGNAPRPAPRQATEIPVLQEPKTWLAGKAFGDT